MRAIIRVNTNIPDERLDDVLKNKGWLPRITNPELIAKRRQEILDTVHEDDIDVVRETMLDFVLLDTASRA